MLHHYGIFALDLAQERNRDLERAAARHRLLSSARESGSPAGQGRIRALVTRPLRAFSKATQSVSDAACTAATRIEGRSA
ncbi:MAG: hypothetical protein ACYC65_07325 [Candidatus Limnocylindrales bacterium]